MTMSIERNMWILPFVKERFPPWPCAICGQGMLLLQKGTYRQEETAESKNKRNHDAWEPEWVHGLFTAHLHCSNPNCNERAVVCGRFKVSEWMDQESGDIDLCEVLEPNFISPAPDVFLIPNRCPEEIKFQIRKAFELY